MLGCCKGLNDIIPFMRGHWQKKHGDMPKGVLLRTVRSRARVQLWGAAEPRKLLVVWVLYLFVLLVGIPMVPRERDSVLWAEGLPWPLAGWC